MVFSDKIKLLQQQFDDMDENPDGSLRGTIGKIEIKKLDEFGRVI